MKVESIKEFLETIFHYHTVNTKQTFTKTETDWGEVRCQPDTRILELTYVQSKVVTHYKSVDRHPRLQPNTFMNLFPDRIHRSIETN